MIIRNVSIVTSLPKAFPLLVGDAGIEKARTGIKRPDVELPELPPVYPLTAY